MKLIKIFLLALVLCVVAGLASAYWINRELHTPVAHTRSDEYVEIPRGASPDEIIMRLQSSGVIRRDWPLRLYVRLTGAAPKIKAGEYKFSTPISPLAVLRKLEEGQQRLARFTIIEGWTRWDVANAMARLPELKLSDADEALALMNNVELIRDLDPDAINLEGYLFPDTYSFPPNTSARQMLAAMVRRSRQALKEAQAASPLDAPHRSVHELVTVASLVETEAKLHEERPVVASVIYNRLAKGIALGIDSTIIYASKLAGKWKYDGKVYQSDLDRVSPYNTRKVAGLPPGPIASPGARSLLAAANPEATNFLYYVRDPARNDGAHNFYDNEADFTRGVQSLRAWEQARDAGTLPPTNGGQP